MTVSQLVSQILLTIGSRPDVRLWRSQPLVAQDRSGRIIRALPKGHPDLTGLLRRTCTCGRPYTAPLYVEAKSETGSLRPEQRQWRGLLDRWGVPYACARSVHDVVDIIGPPPAKAD